MTAFVFYCACISMVALAALGMIFTKPTLFWLAMIPAAASVLTAAILDSSRRWPQ